MSRPDGSGPDGSGPVTPEPVTPEPVTPGPVTPGPVTPEPDGSGPVTPEPDGSGPDGSRPVTPEPVTPERLPDVLADLLLAAAPGDRPGVLRVVVDGAPAAAPARLADALVDPLRLRGRPALRVSAEWFLRPASVRLERGRTDSDAYYEDRLDVGALRREVLDPLGPGGSGHYLPTLWDAAADRATRAGYLAAPAGAVLLLDGALLLGRHLPADLTVHIRLSRAALARRTPAPERWTLPAFARYEADVDPAAAADLVIRMDDPRHPAISARAIRPASR